MARYLFARKALTPDGWARDVTLELDSRGRITAVRPDSEGTGAEPIGGLVVPGMANLHCHAFQRAMAGFAERAGPADDSFWTWRDLMYRFVERLEPDHMQAVAMHVYIEMLKAGYTSVAEFHYLHHDRNGEPYADVAETSLRMLEASLASGIGLTLLPVLYTYGGFDRKPAEPGQRRFLNSLEGYQRLLEALIEAAREDGIAIGLAPHSLRASTVEDIAAAREALPDGAPVHIHIAEQEREVEACVAWCGRRPVAYLLDEMKVDGDWCLVHATHMDDDEARRLASCGAVAGLCPTTEANLGDGLFPAVSYLGQGGLFGIGSDSNISISPIEELRWLEYGQRLLHRRRAALAPGPGRSTGERLYTAAATGGSTAIGRPAGRLAPDHLADLVVLDDRNPILARHDEASLMDALVFSGNRSLVRHVMVAGRWVVRDGAHEREEAAFRGFERALGAMLS